MNTCLKMCLTGLALLTTLSGAVHAGETQNLTPATKTQLAKLCDGCVLVAAQRIEERKSKASGLGAVGGAVLGGLLGNQFGGGKGKAITTVGGAVAGGMAGNEIEKRSNKHTVWITTVQRKDGTSHVYESGTDTGLMVGDVAKPDSRGQLKRQPNK